MGVGFVALAAAQQAAAGVDLNAVEAAARSAVPRGHVFIVGHRLDNLRRSGRIRRGASLLGSALSLKPLLCLDVDGRLVLGQRIRTATKAHAAVIDQVAEVVSAEGPMAYIISTIPTRRRDRQDADRSAPAGRSADRHRYGSGACRACRCRRGRHVYGR
jgi:fatty acid-binding protein DegV